MKNKIITERIVNIEELEAYIRSAYSDIERVRKKVRLEDEMSKV